MNASGKSIDDIGIPVVAIDRLCIGIRQADKSLRRVVDDVNLIVHPGEIVALVGESGSGKTMIGRSILQLLPPVAHVEQGNIRFLGRELLGAGEAALRAVRGREIGMVFQEPLVSLNPALTVGYQMTEALKLHYRLSDSEAKQRCLAMLERVRINDPAGCFNSYPHQFSGGMRQRIMLASVLVMKPKLLIADEPTTALDSLSQKEVMDIMVELTREIGTAVLLVSHDLGLVAHYADRVVVMRLGRILESGDTESTLLQPKHEYTRALLDSLPVQVDAPQDKRIGEPIIEIRALRVEFKTRAKVFWKKPKVFLAVDDAHLDIFKGETLAVVGESGSGKTTIGRTLLRLAEEDSGSIRFEGRDVSALDKRQLIDYRLQMQMVFQDPFSSLDPRMTLAAIVAEGLRNVSGLGGKERLERARAMLAEVGVPADFALRFPHELSGGQRQRVCIARAIVGTPKFLVADEPVSALDLTIQKQILVLLDKLQEKFGFTYLFISHDLGVVEQIADRVVVMYRGRILEIGSRAAIYGDPRHPYTIKLLQATPRLSRTAAGGYSLGIHEAEQQQPPHGHIYFNHGSIAGLPQTPGPAVMVPVSENHSVACAQAV